MRLGLGMFFRTIDRMEVKSGYKCYICKCGDSLCGDGGTAVDHLAKCSRRPHFSSEEKNVALALEELRRQNQGESARMTEPTPNPLLHEVEVLRNDLYQRHPVLAKYGESSPPSRDHGINFNTVHHSCTFT